jgi:hypothetical protein
MHPGKPKLEVVMVVSSPFHHMPTAQAIMNAGIMRRDGTQYSSAYMIAVGNVKNHTYKTAKEMAGAAEAVVQEGLRVGALSPQRAAKAKALVRSLCRKGTRVKRMHVPHPLWAFCAWLGCMRIQEGVVHPWHSCMSSVGHGIV